MIFQVLSDKGKVMMRTEHFSCLPKDSELASLSKAGYKFKIDGKQCSLKRVKEYIAGGHKDDVSK